MPTNKNGSLLDYYTTSDTLQKTLAVSFTSVYPPDSFDPLTGEYNGVKVKGYSARALANKYWLDSLTMWSSFLGLPNQSTNGSQSWKNIGLNLIGWQENDTQEKNAFDYFMILPTLLWNLTWVIPKLAINLIKLVTEFLPNSLGRLCRFGMESAYDHMETTKAGIFAELGYAFLFGAATVGKVIFDVSYFAGQALTSPIKGVRSAWRLGEKMGGTGLFGKILGGVLVTISIGITVTAYTFALPLAAKVIGPVILSKMPVVVTKAVAATSNYLTPVFSTIGNYILPVFAKAFTAIGITVSPTAVGVAAIGSALACTVGTLADRGMNWFKKKWTGYRRASQPSNTQSSDTASTSTVVPAPTPYPQTRPVKIPKNTSFLPKRRTGNSFFSYSELSGEKRASVATPSSPFRLGSSPETTT